MTRRVTMSDVAREAGVSLMTVSRVVNGKGEISPATRDRVKDVIDALGYRPSGIARSLATHQTNTIGLVVPDIANPFFSSMAQGVTSVANAEAFGVLLCDCAERPERETAMLDVLDEKRVDGVLLAAPRSTTAQLQPVLERHPHTVIVNRVFENADDLSELTYVINDDKAGGTMATKFLLDGGHSRIGFLAGPRTSFGSMQRDRGYRSALREAGLEYRRQYVQYCSPTVKGGWEIGERLLQDHPEISAVFCFNDLVAIGLLHCCRALGKSVPDDLAIIGYDDIPMASWVTPALTTCKVQFEEMGRAATQLLIGQISDSETACDNVVLQPTIIVRGSAP
jgi:LacI family transcriptional regulator